MPQKTLESLKNWPKPPVQPNQPTPSTNETNQAERTAETRVSIISPPENSVPPPPCPELGDTLVNVDISLAVGKNLSDADVHRFMRSGRTPALQRIVKGEIFNGP